MYRSFYGFNNKPFSLTPDPDFLYISKHHKEAFAHLFYGIRAKAGFIELIGEVGSGKTTVIRTLLNQLEKELYTTALIFNPCLSALELLRNINREYGLPFDGFNNSELINLLNDFLLRENAAGHTVVLVIDEAQNLEPAVLEQIRLISNLETEKEKLIQILLVGQPELEELLKKPEMRQLSQRITVHYHMKPMDYADTAAYIKHRLDTAEGKEKIVFSRRALKKIFHYSKGLPRLVNIACERSLLAGYMENTSRISGHMVSSAIADAKRMNKIFWSFRLIASSLFLFIFFIGMGVYFFIYDDFSVKFGLQEKKIISAAVPTKQSISIPDPVPTKPKMSLAEFSGAALKELSSTDKKVNIKETFNAMAVLYNISMLSNDENTLSLDKLFHERRVYLYKYTGNLGSLLHMNCPAIMELIIQPSAGNRYVALTGLEGDQLIITPSILGKKSLTIAEMEMIWTGRSYIPWKNVQKIPYYKKTGTAGPCVIHLQEMLKEVGIYKGSISAVFNKSTKEAVTKFQEKEGIFPNGVVGNQTLFWLYCKVNDRMAIPALVKGL
ncbi:MAG: AAA family ATPase [Smithella sp.]